ncbi:helix-turn-helix domain-containing protein [Parabacteroides sp.]
MEQGILIQQASLSDIEAVVRKVLDDLKPQKSEDSIRLLTRAEAAKMLRISLPTLADWTRQGMIPAQRIGRRVLYAISDIENTLEGKKGGRKNG